jgi:hypothetical protein
MRRKGNKDKLNVKIDLISIEREKISEQAMGNVLGGIDALCMCKDYGDLWNDTNRTIM